MKPGAGAMTGAFHFAQHDTIQFLELLSITEESGSLSHAGAAF
jgi:hypothetical protein